MMKMESKKWVCVKKMICESAKMIGELVGLFLARGFVLNGFNEDGFLICLVLLYQAMKIGMVEKFP